MRRALALAAAKPLAVASVAAAALALAGCADVTRLGQLTSNKADPRSPVAGTVEAVAASSPPYMRFSDIPPKPTDRPAEGWKSDVVAQVNARRELNRWIAQNPPLSPGDTESFAQALRRQAPPPGADAPPADQAQQSDAYAARLRQEAAAPPPPR